MSKTVRQSDWATETLMEAPFWKNGMTPEEYETENRYLSIIFYKQKDGYYMPLWMQVENMKELLVLWIFLFTDKIYFILKSKQIVIISYTILFYV